MELRLIVRLFFLGMCSISATAAGAVPDTSFVGTGTSPAYSETLTGDWGGRRTAMYDAGYDWEIFYKLDLLGKVSPSGNKVYGLDNLDIKLALDGEKIAGINGSSALLYVLSNRGGKPVAQGNHSAGLDNIETPENANTTKLYQAWLQQLFFDGRLSVLAGLYDLNSEFYVSEPASLFIQSVYGIGAELADTGKNGPSIFPTTSMALRTKFETAGYYIQAVTLDGVPGDPDNPHGTHVQFNKGDGALNVVEGGLPLCTDAHHNKLALGTWRYTVRVDDLLDPLVKRISHGYYVLLEKVLRDRKGGNEPGISGFVRAGKADGDTAQFDETWSTGLVVSGLFGRGQDQSGVAYAQERNGEKWRIYSGNPTVFDRSLEFTYRYQIKPGMVLQPTVQYLVNQSSNPARGDNWWLGMRAEFSL